MSMFILVFLVWFIIMPSTGLAGTASTGIGVSIDVNAECLVSASQVNFGDFTGKSDITTTGSLSVQCTVGTPYTIHLSGGTHLAANGRQLGDAQNVNFMGYELFQDNAHTLRWGGNAYTYQSASPLGSTGSGFVQNYTMFGVLYKLQTSLPPGSYTDVVQVVVSY